MRSAIALGLLATAAFVALPLSASAQDRRQQAYNNMNALEETQRLNELDRQLSNIEIRQKSEEVLQSLSRPKAVTDRARNAQWDAEQETSNARLRLNAVQRAAESRTPLARGERQVRAQAIDDLERQVVNAGLEQRTAENLQMLAAASPVAPDSAIENPYTPAYLSPSAQRPTGAADRARDAELAASNARLRAIGQEQRARDARRRSR